jgi:hypothetical protein
MHHQPIDSLDAARCITCGDVNPDCFMGLFFSPLVSGGLGYRSLLSQTVLPVPFSTVAGRRLPLCPLLFASHSFTVAGSRTPYHEAFSTFAVHFRRWLPDQARPFRLPTSVWLWAVLSLYPGPRARVIDDDCASRSCLGSGWDYTLPLLAIAEATPRELLVAMRMGGWGFWRGFGCTGTSSTR